MTLERLEQHLLVSLKEDESVTFSFWNIKDAERLVHIHIHFCNMHSLPSPAQLKHMHASPENVLPPSICMKTMCTTQKMEQFPSQNRKSRHSPIVRLCQSKEQSNAKCM